ncbi:transporter substrate-binding domain-containing protein [Jiella avicenniae]|uniref:Transporter substrate-binding domain-containing protein n=1 Tax=Jiella avicenniae TaxID=2907202 RepID=A0A9X1T4B4_9HYPH|nr:transporter substrate-binding domain-containing protein [Jiella avicenniae]MCE7027717.1 transporter substrate-binding domain-containing protein [Jiella avicenniae]MCE7028759.1 transporter substrate-binding domain-containing protein [Jiella avicenniae]
MRLDRDLLPRFALRRLALAAVLLAPLAGAGVSDAKAADLEAIKSSGTMHVATEDDFHPFEFIEDGKPSGYDNALLDLVREKAPFEIEQDIIPWAGILPGVTTGKYDMAVTAVLVNDERKQTLAFTSPVAESTSFYVMKKGQDGIASASDLSGKTVGVQAGSAMLKHLQTFDAKLKADGGAGIARIVEYQSYPEAYQDLAIGRTDAVVNTLINVQALVNEKPDVFELGEAVSEPVYIAWATAKGNDALVEYVSSVLLEARKDGTMYELQKKWFGASFEDMPEAIK